MSNIAWPDLVTTIYADERFKLGTERVESPQEVNSAAATHYGARTWVFIKTTVLLAKGQVVAPVTAGTGSETPFLVTLAEGTGEPACIVQGVAQHVVTVAKPYAWVVKRGMCEVLCDGSVTARSPITTAATDGSVTDMVDGLEEAVIGVALTIDAGTTLVTAIVRCGA